ncbi:MAG: DUF4212 domain-containing protein [Planctomycetota bacterium]
MTEPNQTAPPDPPAPPSPQQREAEADLLKRYWRANLTIMSVLLFIWAIVGLGCGILFADFLNDAGAIGGVPLGFWFAQQGSIMTFVLIILVYCVLLNRLDKRHQEELASIRGSTEGSAAR